MRANITYVSKCLATKEIFVFEKKKFYEGTVRELFLHGICASNYQQISFRNQSAHIQTKVCALHENIESSKISAQSFCIVKDAIPYLIDHKLVCAA